MPGRDRTGSMGYGPGTGWGAGSCTDNPDTYIPGHGFGRGYGRGRGFRGGLGMGRRVRGGGSLQQLTSQEERCFLEDEMEALQKRLNFAKLRIEELSAQEKTES